MKKFFFLMFVFLHFMFPLSAKDKFFVVGVPMAGDQFFKELFDEISHLQGTSPEGKGPRSIYKSSRHILEDGKKYLFVHSSKFYKILDQFHTPSSTKKLVFVRDPRDMLVAWMHYKNARPDPSWLAKSPKEKLRFLMLNGLKMNGEVFNLSLLYDTLKKFLDLHPNAKILRLEDFIVGGENSLSIQVQGICSHIGWPISPSQALQISRSILKKPATTSTERIGIWKTVFDQELEQLFNQKYQYILSDWKYKKETLKPPLVNKEEKKKEKIVKKKEEVVVKKKEEPKEESKEKEEEGPSIWERISSKLKRRRELY